MEEERLEWDRCDRMLVSRFLLVDLRLAALGAQVASPSPSCCSAPSFSSASNTGGERPDGCDRRAGESCTWEEEGKERWSTGDEAEAVRVRGGRRVNRTDLMEDGETICSNCCGEKAAMSGFDCSVQSCWFAASSLSSSKLTESRLVVCLARRMELALAKLAELREGDAAATVTTREESWGGEEEMRDWGM